MLKEMSYYEWNNFFLFCNREFTLSRDSSWYVYILDNKFCLINALCMIISDDANLGYFLIPGNEQVDLRDNLTYMHVFPSLYNKIIQSVYFIGDEESGDHWEYNSGEYWLVVI